MQKDQADSLRGLARIVKTAQIKNNMALTKPSVLVTRTEGSFVAKIIESFNAVNVTIIVVDFLCIFSKDCFEPNQVVTVEANNIALDLLIANPDIRLIQFDEPIPYTPAIARQWRYAIQVYSSLFDGLIISSADFAKALNSQYALIDIHPDTDSVRAVGELISKLNADMPNLQYGISGLTCPSAFISQFSDSLSLKLNKTIFTFDVMSIEGCAEWLGLWNKEYIIQNNEQAKPHFNEIKTYMTFREAVNG